MLVPDEVLALVDSVAKPNRTAFMLSVARDAAKRIARELEDQEIARILDQNADLDRALNEEFAGTMADGL